MKKLVVLDYNTGEVHVYTLTKEQEAQDLVDVVDDLGHNVIYCEYMSTNEKITIH